MTLTLGIAASMFTALVVTRLIFDILLQNKLLTKIPMLKLLPETKINFTKYRKICYALSIIVIAIGMLVFAKRGDRNYGVDFSGGTIQEYEFTNNVDIDKVRKALEDLGLNDATVQQFRDDPKKLMIKTQKDSSLDIENKFKEALNDNQFSVLRVETVGPAIGAELKNKAAISLILGILAIMVYVWIRFNFLYGLAGVVALFHDIFVTMGFLAITHRQFDLNIVAALLTIAGYSINDTVVIYDRIRENMKYSRKGTFDDLLNLSVNQTLSRTLLTSFSTMLVVWALLYAGGDVINGFSFALFVGFISGIYSTVFIVTQLISVWQKKFKVRLRK